MQQSAPRGQEYILHRIAHRFQWSGVGTFFMVMVNFRCWWAPFLIVTGGEYPITLVFSADFPPNFGSLCHLKDYMAPRCTPSLLGGGQYAPLVICTPPISFMFRRRSFTQNQWVGRKLIGWSIGRGTMGRLSDVNTSCLHLWSLRLANRTFTRHRAIQINSLPIVYDVS